MAKSASMGTQHAPVPDGVCVPLPVGVPVSVGVEVVEPVVEGVGDSDGVCEAVPVMLAVILAVTVAEAVREDVLVMLEDRVTVWVAGADGDGAATPMHPAQSTVPPAVGSVNQP